MASKDILPVTWRGKQHLWDPNREMHRLQHRIDQMFEDFFNISNPSEQFFRDSLQTQGFTPFCDTDETDSHYLLSFDLPGVKKNDVKIELTDNQLSIAGERKGESKRKESSERFYGSFYRSFTLPSNVDPEKIEASFEDGVLQISIPKTQISPGKQIPIKEGKLLSSKSEKGK